MLEFLEELVEGQRLSQLLFGFTDCPVLHDVLRGVLVGLEDLDLPEVLVVSGLDIFDRGGCEGGRGGLAHISIITDLLLTLGILSSII